MILIVINVTRLNMSNYLIVDSNNLMFKLFSVMDKDIKASEDFHIFVANFLHRVRLLERIYDIDQIVLTTEGRKTFRKDLFAEYKANRKDSRKKLDEHIKVFSDFYKMFQLMLVDIQNNGNSIILYNPKLEGDDIVAILTKELDNGVNKVVIVSNDKDFKQLINENVTQVDISKGELKDEQYDIRIHCITGDKIDNIFGIKEGVGEVRAKSILNDEYLYKMFFSQPERVKRFELNKKLIDLDLIPPQYTNELLQRFNEKKQALKINTENITNFILKYYKTDSPFVGFI